MAEAAVIVDAPTLVFNDIGKRRYVLWLLLRAFALGFLYRHVLMMLGEPIRHHLNLIDTEFGMLTRLVLVVFYTFLDIPIARLAERKSGPAIIVVSMALWSAFTALSGLATSFVPMALARLGVGFGEAGCNPSAHSMIADIMPKEK